MKLLALSAAVFGLFLSATTSPEVDLGGLDVVSGRAEVTDGDSFRIGEHRIRLFGIDAVEGRQTCLLGTEEWDCGRASRRALERLAEGREVVCLIRDTDRTRLVSVCHADGVELNAQMVRRGWAVAYTDFSLDYVDEERAARAEGLALWRSQFERPHDYRARLRAEQASEAAEQDPPSSDCAIKGNISRNGTRIYHLPGQADYERTRINEDEGEQWFCSPAGAERAGWRQAMR